ncbi:hypothetical protein FHR83_006649 [Actinoplanes campanulatus]|uniref:Uncharacterized protein n=1 Tax=Actinoplanes campanulatus TaxID=113559 RepID=A0A7W5AMD5_9ACTN|nr:hypothetical protein [Actinoplanes campanulatus]MBB3098943.1 hypothetical protein [Actinoplanes campanulatus]GGN39746.1 hypothetical protein GCM10010109_68070 [Actinoplanes campanulatus]
MSGLWDDDRYGDMCPVPVGMLDIAVDRAERLSEIRPDAERHAFGDDPAGDDEFGRDDR